MICDPVCTSSSSYANLSIGVISVIDVTNGLEKIIHWTGYFSSSIWIYNVQMKTQFTNILVSIQYRCFSIDATEYRTVRYRYKISKYRHGSIDFFDTDTISPNASCRTYDLQTEGFVSVAFSVRLSQLELYRVFLIRNLIHLLRDHLLYIRTSWCGWLISNFTPVIYQIPKVCRN